MKVDKKQLEGTVEFLELTCRGLPDSAWRQYRYAINTLRAVLTDGVEFEDRTDSTWWTGEAERVRSKYLPRPKTDEEVSALILAWWESAFDSEEETALASCLANLAYFVDNKQESFSWFSK